MSSAPALLLLPGTSRQAPLARLRSTLPLRLHCVLSPLSQACCTTAPPPLLVLAWAIVWGRGKGGAVRNVDRRSLLFLGLSGLATGASWLCYYSALQTGLASVVVPIDKLSILVSVAFARVVFGERLTRKAGAGLALLVVGTLLLLL